VCAPAGIDYPGEYNSYNVLLLFILWYDEKYSLYSTSQVDYRLESVTTLGLTRQSCLFSRRYSTLDVEESVFFGVGDKVTAPSLALPLGGPRSFRPPRFLGVT